MNDSLKIKNPSPFLQSVLKLDNYFSELVRLGEKIETIDLKSDFDFDQVERLVRYFAECGEGVSQEVVVMSQALSDLRGQAEHAAKIVAVRADILQTRKEEQQRKMEEFRLLGEKVRDLTSSLNGFRLQEGVQLTEEEQAQLKTRLAEFETQLRPLIEEALTMKKIGQESKIKILEQGADSLGQSLKAVSQKISAVHNPHP